jgi:hypothetical protein
MEPGEYEIPYGGMPYDRRLPLIRKNPYLDKRGEYEIPYANPIGSYSL